MKKNIYDEDIDILDITSKAKKNKQHLYYKRIM